MFTPSFTPRGEHSLLFRRMEGQPESFTPRDNFTPWDKVHHWRTTSPLGSKFAPRVKVKNGPNYFGAIFFQGIEFDEAAEEEERKQKLLRYRSRRTQTITPSIRSIIQRIESTTKYLSNRCYKRRRFSSETATFSFFLFIVQAEVMA
jgi:hypothetical protein